MTNNNIETKLTEYINNTDFQNGVGSFQDYFFEQSIKDINEFLENTSIENLDYFFLTFVNGSFSEALVNSLINSGDTDLLISLSSKSKEIHPVLYHMNRVIQTKNIDVTYLSLFADMVRGFNKFDTDLHSFERDILRLYYDEDNYSKGFIVFKNYWIKLSLDEQKSFLEHQKIDDGLYSDICLLNGYSSDKGSSSFYKDFGIDIKVTEKDQSGSYDDVLDVRIIKKILSSNNLSDEEVLERFSNFSNVLELIPFLRYSADNKGLSELSDSIISSIDEKSISEIDLNGNIHNLDTFSQITGYPLDNYMSLFNDSDIQNAIAFDFNKQSYPDLSSLILLIETGSFSLNDDSFSLFIDNPSIFYRLLGSEHSNLLFDYLKVLPETMNEDFLNVLLSNEYNIDKFLKDESKFDIIINSINSTSTGSKEKLLLNLLSFNNTKDIMKKIIDEILKTVILDGNFEGTKLLSMETPDIKLISYVYNKIKDRNPELLSEFISKLNPISIENDDDIYLYFLLSSDEKIINDISLFDNFEDVVQLLKSLNNKDLKKFLILFFNTDVPTKIISESQKSYDKHFLPVIYDSIKKAGVKFSEIPKYSFDYLPEGSDEMKSINSKSVSSLIETSDTKAPKHIRSSKEF